MEVRQKVKTGRDNDKKTQRLVLEDGSRIAIIGGGPSGSLFGYFLLKLAKRIDTNLLVNIYERRDFSQMGPAGCNMCGGVISESLIQALSVEGINLPETVVQRGIHSFIFHTAEDTVTLSAPFREMRIATVYRGAGPKGTLPSRWQSFDGYLLELANDQGAAIIHDRVTDISWAEGRPQVHVKDKPPQSYDFVVGAIGVNTQTAAIFQKLVNGYKPPKTRKTYNIEFELGFEYISNELGNSMHAFLINLPRLDFAAIIPKGDYVTTCLIGDNINSDFVDSFVKNPVVNRYLAGKNDHHAGACHCSPSASLGNAVQPYGDRVLLIGDCGMTRLNKDGIGSAYRVAKVAAVTALFKGISAEDFHRGYWPLCRAISRDNAFGNIIFRAVDLVKKSRFLTRAVMRMAGREQLKASQQQHMSRVLWDMFTGSAPYYDVFLRCLHPRFWSRFIWYMFVKPRALPEAHARQEESMNTSVLGKEYRRGQTIIRQGEPGDCMYVIQSGQAEVIQSKDGRDIQLALLGNQDTFGEMALYRMESRSATVRAVTDVRALTVDKKIFLRRAHEDPSFVFAILQKMSQRIYEMNTELTRRKNQSGSTLKS